MVKVHTGERLKTIMRERNLKQVDILNLTKIHSQTHGVKVSKQDLSQYVQEKVEPNQWKLAILAKALDVSEAWLLGFDVPMLKQASLTTNEQDQDLLTIYDQLESPRQQVVYETAVEQLTEQKQVAVSNETHLTEYADELTSEFPFVIFEQYRERRSGIVKLISETRASAGSGVMLYDDSDFLDIRFPEEEVYDDSKEVIGVIVTGDSMEPKYYEGDVLWIDSRLPVENGQIGIFTVDGENFVKRKGTNKLVSLNTKYDDIEIHEYTEFAQVGKVVDFTPRSVFEQIKNIQWV